LIDPDNLNFVLYANPEIYFNGETLQVKIPKINGYLSAKINPATDPVLKETFQTNIDICNATETGTIKNSVSQLDGQTVLQLQALGANNCSASFWLPNLPHKISYLITSQSHNQTGQIAARPILKPICLKPQTPDSKLITSFSRQWKTTDWAILSISTAPP